MTAADALIAAGIVTATITAGYAIARLARSFWVGFKLAVREATEDLHEDVVATKKIVTYHLGPNGTTKPMHDRLGTLEKDLRQHMTDAAERNQGDNP